MHFRPVRTDLWILAIMLLLVPVYVQGQQRAGNVSSVEQLEVLRAAESLEERAQTLDLIPGLLEYARENRDKELELELLDRRYSTYQDMGRYQEMIDGLDPEADRWLGKERGFVLVNLLANAHTSQGNFERALSLYQRVLEQLEGQGEERYVAGIEQNMGLVYNNLGDVDAALSRFLNSLDVIRSLGDRETESTILNNIGEVYRAEAEFEMARDYLTRSLEVSREIGDRSGQSRALLNLGLVYKDSGETGKALQTLDESLELAGSENRIRPIQVLFNKGMVHLNRHEYEAARGGHGVGRFSHCAHRLPRNIEPGRGTFPVPGIVECRGSAANQ